MVFQLSLLRAASGFSLHCQVKGRNGQLEPPEGRLRESAGGDFQTPCLLDTLRLSKALHSAARLLALSRKWTENCRCFSYGRDFDPGYH